VLTVAGGGGGGGQNAGRGFISMADWDDRAGDQNTARSDHAPRHARHELPRSGILRSAAAHRARSGPVHRLSAELQNTGGLSRDQFAQMRDQILADARADKRMANVRLTNLPDQPTLRITTDTAEIARWA
jgi:multidrug efflux pump